MHIKSSAALHIKSIFCVLYDFVFYMINMFFFIFLFLLVPNSLWWKEGDSLRLWQQVSINLFYRFHSELLHSNSVYLCIQGFTIFPWFSFLHCLHYLIQLPDCDSSVILVWMCCELFLQTGCYCTFSWLPVDLGFCCVPHDSSVPDCCVCFQSHMPMCPVWGCVSAWSEEDSRPGAHCCGHKAGGWLYQQDRRRSVSTDMRLIF